MLGKLARELRLLGIDCAYQKEPEYEATLRKAKKEDRILLTRNSKLKNMESAIFIESEKVSEQVEQVLKTFPDLAINPMTRCLICNGTLVESTKENVKLKVPFYVYQTQERFNSCSDCGRIYWRGTHYENMKNRVNQYLKKKVE